MIKGRQLSAVLGRLPGGEPPRLETGARGEAGVWVNGGRVSEVHEPRQDRRFRSPEAHRDGAFFPRRIVAEDREGHHLGIEGVTVKLDGKLVYRSVLGEFRFDQYPQVGLLLTRPKPPFAFRIHLSFGQTSGKWWPWDSSALLSILPLDATGAAPATIGGHGRHGPGERQHSVRLVSASAAEVGGSLHGGGQYPDSRCMLVGHRAQPGPLSRSSTHSWGRAHRFPVAFVRFCRTGVVHLPSLPGVPGVTATALLDGVPVARATHLPSRQARALSSPKARSCLA
jgi:hypothetical protein